MATSRKGEEKGTAMVETKVEPRGTEFSYASFMSAAAAPADAVVAPSRVTARGGQHGAFATSVMPDTHARNPLARKRSAWTTVQKEEDGEEARESHKAYAQWRNERRQV